ncbi:MAG: hypothetical protein K2Q25_10320 [Mycobacteriaceae bacterium]|nr:hypothetical protein [Mycobacteriaceae bacterium]
MGWLDKKDFFGNEGDDSWDSEKIDEIIKAALYVVLLAGVLVGIVVGSQASKKKHHSHSQDSDDEAAQAGGEFAVSGACLRDINAILRGVDPGCRDGWTGGAAASLRNVNGALGDLISQVAEANDEVYATAQTQDRQVKNARSTLENLFNELNAAIPVARSLYFSGPAGPALSYNFQLAVSNPAASTTLDTTNAMHEHAQENADRFSELSQKYEQLVNNLPVLAGRPVAG